MYNVKQNKIVWGNLIAHMNVDFFDWWIDVPMRSPRERHREESPIGWLIRRHLSGLRNTGVNKNFYVCLIGVSMLMHPCHLVLFNVWGEPVFSVMAASWFCEKSG
jgi:hypothetical protein